MYGRIDKWTDKYGNDLEKAKKVVSDKNISLINLSKATNIPYSSIRIYSHDPSKLDNASWKRIKLLANAFVQATVESKMTDADMQDYPPKLMEKFQEWKVYAAKQNQNTSSIEKIEEIVMSDPLAVAEVFEADNS